MKRKVVFFFLLLLLLVPLGLYTLQSFSKAAPIKANIQVNTRHIIFPLKENWKALAQGGEEKSRMLGNVVPQLKELSPRYIRIDHIYDFYDVVSRDSAGNIVYTWDKLDETVCDIFATGAKPFLSLGYMPPAISADGSLISAPKNWNDWATLVQKTIERYSGRGTTLCGGSAGSALTNIFYEVWNEPDLEQFGKWNIYGGTKDYKLLYYYSAQGAARAQNVSEFSLGGPAITAAYRNWFQSFLKYVDSQNLRIDFLSWHHYTKNPNDYTDDLNNINSWIPQESYGRYSALPKVLSEWGYDSYVNSIADTDIGAAYTIASLRNLIDQHLDLAFSFEAKDGPNPSWGILTNSGEKKPRYHALKLLNLLQGSRLELQGEGTFVRALASASPQKTTVILTNYDQRGQNTELVPVTFLNLTPGTYQLVQTDLKGQSSNFDNIVVDQTSYTQSVIMLPNSVLALELFKK